MEVAGAGWDARVGIWFGPVASGLGVHRVRVAARRDSELPAFVEVREAVLKRWREVESDRLLAERIAALKAEYEVEIDQSALDGFNAAQLSAETRESKWIAWSSLERQIGVAETALEATESNLKKHRGFLDRSTAITAAVTVENGKFEAGRAGRRAYDHAVGV